MQQLHLGQHLCSGLFVPIIWVIAVVYVYRCSCWDTKRGVRRSGNIISGITGLIVDFVMLLVARVMKSANICQMIYRIQQVYRTYPSKRTGLIVDFVMPLAARIIKSANISQMIYCIQPIYHTYPSKSTVKQFHSLQIIASVLIGFFFINAYVVGTHLNCIDLSMQFKWVHKTYDFIK